MWTASLGTVQIWPDRLLPQVNVTYTDGTQKFTEPVQITAALAPDGALKAHITHRIAEISACYAFVATAKGLSGQDAAALPDAPPQIQADPTPPDDATVAKQAFVVAYRRMEGVTRAIAMGALVGDEAWVTALRKTVSDAMAKNGSDYADLL